ncbi:MAG: hypothetical protein IPN18_13850 [Ignavibacteriales bacterium]|nr:hypothetical protein [Ignavibacteriales bacterium]
MGRSYLGKDKNHSGLSTYSLLQEEDRSLLLLELKQDSLPHSKDGDLTKFERSGFSIDKVSILSSKVDKKLLVWDG